MLTEITLKDFRCFHEQQTARLAPLTLLVGENSTGKTSFMAMIRAMWQVASGDIDPDFKAAPYDLGSFEEIAHSRGAKGSKAASFASEIAMPFRRSRRSAARGGLAKFKVEFAERGTAPAPVLRRVQVESAWIEQSVRKDGKIYSRVAATHGEWDCGSDPFLDRRPHSSDPLLWRHLLFDLERGSRRLGIREFSPVGSSPDIQEADVNEIARLAGFALFPLRENEPYASAPVRSTPRRTYDPARPVRDPLGEHVPMYLAEIAAQSGAEWEMLKSALESVGQVAGLFDELRIRRFAKSANAPFQVQVRKGGGGLKGPWRNLIDVGYGVSQVLPVLTELLQPDAPQLSLWQQPEVHLHPSAQAALATFFCGLAADGKQLIIETHGDYLIDRVRMDVRDGKTGLKPEDVSVLYFERTGLDVQIHSLRFDAQGNVLDAPSGYRQFFLEETHRSVWGDD